MGCAVFGLRSLCLVLRRPLGVEVGFKVITQCQTHRASYWSLDSNV